MTYIVSFYETEAYSLLIEFYALKFIFWLFLSSKSSLLPWGCLFMMTLELDSYKYCPATSLLLIGAASGTVDLSA